MLKSNQIVRETTLNSPLNQFVPHSKQAGESQSSISSLFIYLLSLASEIYWEGLRKKVFWHSCYHFAGLGETICGFVPSLWLIADHWWPKADYPWNWIFLYVKMTCVLVCCHFLQVWHLGYSFIFLSTFIPKYDNLMLKMYFFFFNGDEVGG